MLNEREVWSLDQIINERGVRGDTKFSTGLDAEDHRMATAAEIAEQLGLTPTGKGGYTGFCPSCCYETGFSVIDKDGKTLFHCHAGGCSQQEIIGWYASMASGTVSLPNLANFPCSDPRRRAKPILLRLLWQYGSARSRQRVLSSKHISGRGAIAAKSQWPSAM